MSMKTTLETVVVCDQCEETLTLASGKVEAMQVVRSAKWLVKGEQTYCPDCRDNYDAKKNASLRAPRKPSAPKVKVLANDLDEIYSEEFTN